MLLFEDPKKNRVFGFGSHEGVRFVLPSEAAERVAGGGNSAGGNGTEDDGFGDPLMQLPGVGSAYAMRLRAAGYEWVDDLSGADPAALAGETGATESRTTEWLDLAERKAE